MSSRLKEILKKVIPQKIVLYYYLLKPDIHSVDIYVLEIDKPIKNLIPIDQKFHIREINATDKQKLKEFYTRYKHILPRLNTSAWIGLGVIDTTTNNIAYISWIIRENTQFIDDFKISLADNQFMIRHGYCDPKYRRQGLHSRMEQERMNYCLNNGASEILVHIASKNEVGIAELIKKGYVFVKNGKIIRIPFFGIHRELFSFLRTPFKKVM